MASSSRNNLPEGDVPEGDDVGDSDINISGESSQEDDEGDIQPYMYVPLFIIIIGF